MAPGGCFRYFLDATWTEKPSVNTSFHSTSGLVVLAGNVSLVRLATKRLEEIVACIDYYLSMGYFCQSEIKLGTTVSRLL